jgi:hypothetical protein
MMSDFFNTFSQYSGNLLETSPKVLLFFFSSSSADKKLDDFANSSAFKTLPCII